MISLKTITSTLLLGTALALVGCSGADDVASPGETALAGGGSPPPPPPPPSGVAAASCPTGFSDLGVFAAGTLRNCGLPSLITGLFTVPFRDGVAYSITGRVDVGVDRGGDAASPIGTAGNLTVEPGVRIFGSAGQDALVINRGSQINAIGTSTAPIIFTSRQSVEGTTTVDSIGQWGGIVILGRANITNCPGSTPAAQASLYGTAACEATVEGTIATYGGNSNGDNSGTLRYVRVQHSGFTVFANNELNGITFGGVGSGTAIDHIQVHNSSDDGIEFFGGTVNLKYVVLTGNDDDSLDTDQGYKGALQFVLTTQRTSGADHLIESSMASNAAAQAAPSGETPNRLTNPVAANFTFIGRLASNGDGDIHLNTGSQFRFYNGISTAANRCLDIDNPDTSGTNAVFRSVFLSCATSFDPDVDGAGPEESVIFGAGVNNNVAGGTSSLASTFINGLNESSVTFTDYASIPGTELSSAIKTFLTPVNYIGAVRDASDNWWQGWTCGLPSTPNC